MPTGAPRPLRRHTRAPTKETTITADYPWPLRFEPRAPKVRNPWATWSLGVALVALAYGLPVGFEAEKDHITHGPTGYPSIVPAQSGPIWLQGRFLTSWWEAAGLLLIVLAVAAGARSLALLARGARHGLGSTVTGLVLASVALIVGNALLVGSLGVAASFVAYGVLRDARASAGGAQAHGTDRVYAPEVPRGWASPMAILALVGAALGLPLSAVRAVSPWVILALWFVSLVLGIVALVRTRSTDEAGRGWAIGAIVVSCVWFLWNAIISAVIWLLWQPWSGG